MYRVLLRIPVALVSISFLFLLLTHRLTLFCLFVDIEVVQSKTLFEQLGRGLDALALLLVQLFDLSHGHRLFKHAEPRPMALLIAVLNLLAERF